MVIDRILLNQPQLPTNILRKICYWPFGNAFWVGIVTRNEPVYINYIVFVKTWNRLTETFFIAVIIDLRFCNNFSCKIFLHIVNALNIKSFLNCVAFPPSNLTFKSFMFRVNRKSLSDFLSISKLKSEFFS